MSNPPSDRSSPLKNSVGLAAAVTVAMTTIASFEGDRATPYKDVGGVPTICYGHTGPDVKPGVRYTESQCELILEQDALKHGNGVVACLTREVPVESLAAFTSFAYNVGVQKFCASSIARKANAGDLAGACNELPRWVLAGGHRMAGLVRRRAAERALCLKGVA